jgi:hypothetical protein
VREHIPQLIEDRPLHDDIHEAELLIESGELLQSVESAVGPLA